MICRKWDQPGLDEDVSDRMMFTVTGLSSPLLADPDPEIRAQMLNLLADTRLVAPTFDTPSLLKDPFPRVQMYAALLIARGGGADFRRPDPGTEQYQAQVQDKILGMLRDDVDQGAYLPHVGAMALATA